MRELTDIEKTAVSGGDGFSFDVGRVPGFGSDGPLGGRATYSFGNGWSVTGGSTLGGSSYGVGVRFVWK